MAVLCAPAGPLRAQTGGRIEARGVVIDGERVRLDERCVVNISNRLARVAADGTYAIPNVPLDEVFPGRVRAVCTREGGVLGAASPLLNLSAPPSDVPLYFVDVPELPVTLRVFAANDRVVLDEPGSTWNLIAIGALPDGRLRDLTLPATGTVWETSDPAVASVSPRGVLTPHARGDVLVRAQNEGLVGTLRIRVRVPDDRDEDGLPDAFEIASGLDPDDPSDALRDDDLDGLDNIQEFAAGTAPQLADTDGDGLLDGREAAVGADPRLADTDDDGLLDGDEFALGTDPGRWDTDGDGIGDGEELELGLDPTRADPTAVIAGRAVDADGLAVAGGVVRLDGRVRDFTDADGRFEVVAVVADDAPVRVAVRAVRRGVVLDGASEALVANADAAFDVGDVVLRPTRGVVGGRVTGVRGDPVAGARVVVRIGDDERATNTDASGGYAIDRFDAGEVAVVVTDPATGLRGRARAVLIEDASVVVDVRLSPSGTLRGTVYDARGRPVPAGTPVVIRGPSSLDVATDALGRFAADFMPVGAYEVEAFDDDGDMGQTAGQISRTSQVVDLEVRFRGAGRVTVRVEHADGAPAIGARVGLQDVRGESGLQVGLTDEDGVHAFETVVVGPFSVSAVEPASELVGRLWGSLSSAGEQVTVTVTLEPAGRIAGRVLEADGVTPVAGARIEVEPGDLSARSAADGAYVIPRLALGRHTLTALHPERADRGAVTVEIAAPGAEVEADVILRGLGSMAVTVLDAVGVPVRGVRVDARPEADPAGRVSAATDDAGRVVFEPLLGGVYAVEAVEPITGRTRGVQTRVRDGQQAEVELRLGSVGRVRGVVVRADGITPLAGIEVRLEPSGRRANTDGAGGFAFEDVPVEGGPYALVAVDSSGAPRASAEGIELLGQGDEQARTLRLAGAGTVRGTVVGPDGLPAFGVRISVDSEVAGARTTRTDAAGRFEVSDVLVGRFSLVARLDGGGAAFVEQAIGFDGHTVVVDLALVEGAIPPAPRGSNPLVAELCDANGMCFDVHHDGRVPRGSAGNFGVSNPLHPGTAGFGLALRSSEDGAAFEPFVTGGGRVDPDGRQIALTGRGPRDLDVTRQIYVPPDGYFVRYLETLTNPNAVAVDVDVRIASYFRSSLRYEQTGVTLAYGVWIQDHVGVVLTDSGDRFFSMDPALGDQADRWVVVDDDVDVDPALSDNRPPVALVLGGPGGRAADSGEFAQPDERRRSVIVEWHGLRIEPGESLSLMHFGAQQLTVAGARAAAERLARAPDEALIGLTPEVRARVVNYDLGAPAAMEPLPGLQGRVDGHVFEAGGRVVVPGARVDWRSLNPLFGRTIRLTADDAGRYEAQALLSGNPQAVVLPEGPFQVRAVHPGTGIATAWAEGRLERGVGHRDLAFEGTGRIEGLVRRADGNVVSRGTVELSGGLVGEGAATAIGADGAFRFGAVPAGGYRLVARVPLEGGTGLVGEGLATVRGVETVRADIDIAATGAITGTVRDGGGDLVIGVGVVIRGDGLERHARTDSGGRFAVTDLPPGVVTVLAYEPATGIATEVEAVVEAQRSVPVDLSLLPLGRLAVEVTHDDGRLAGGASLRVQRVGLGAPLDVRFFTDRFGRAVIPSVPIGAFALIVTSGENPLVSQRVEGVIEAHGQALELAVVLPSDAPPTVRVSLPAAGAQVTEGAPLELRAATTDDLGIRRVDFLVDGVWVGSDLSEPYGVVVPMPAGEGGARVVVQAVAIDNGPNQVVSAPIGIVRIDDAEPPEVELSAPAAGARIVAGTEVALVAAADDDSGVERVEFRRDGVFVGADVSPPYATTLTVGPTGGEPRPVRLTATAFDRAGNSAESAVDVTVVPDAPPTIRLTRGPAEGAPVIEGATVVFEAAAEDDVGVRVDLVDGGVVRQTRSDPPFVFEWVASPAGDAPAAVVLRAVDTAGQTAEVRAQVAIEGDRPPTVAIIRPEAGTSRVEGARVTVEVDADDDRGVVATRYLVDGALVEAREGPARSAEVRIPPGVEGEAVVLRVVAVDARGQTAAAERRVIRERDAQAPVARMVSPIDEALVSPAQSDVLVLIDTSFDTAESSGVDLDGDGLPESSLQAEVMAAEQLSEALDLEADRLAIARFWSGLTVIRSFDDEVDMIPAALDGIRAAGSGGLRDLDTALSMAVDVLVGDLARRAAASTIFLVTAGGDPPPLRVAPGALEAAGITVHVVRVGHDAADGVLRQLARDTGGGYVVVDEADDLAALRGSILAGRDALSVIVDATDETAVRDVTVRVFDADGAIDRQIVDEAAPFAGVVSLPAVRVPTRVTVQATARDFGDNIAEAEPVVVNLLPAATDPIIESLIVRQPDTGMPIPELLAGSGLVVGDAHGSPGDIVYLRGRFFEPVEARTRVDFGGVPAEVLLASKTELRVRIPDDAMRGPLSWIAGDFEVAPIPFAVDRDLDGLDGEAEAAAGLDPDDPDTDGDGLLDGVEVQVVGTEPLVADTDGDGLDDGFEVAAGFEPIATLDGLDDPDGDGLKNITEFRIGTLPDVADTDGDGLGDGLEVDVYGSDPSRVDSDGGGVGDGDEVLIDDTDPVDPLDDARRVGFDWPLVDGDGYVWDVQSTGAIRDGSDNAYDSGLRLSVNRLEFPPAAVGRLLEGGRALRLGPARVLGLLVEREIYVPADARFARFLELLHNDGDAPVEAEVRIFGTLGSRFDTTIVGTSAAEAQVFDARDDYVVTDEAVEGIGGPVLTHVFSGPDARIEPTRARMLGTDAEWVFTVTVPPGEAVGLLHFAVQSPDRSSALAAGQALLTLTEAHLAGLSAAEQAAVVNRQAFVDTDGDGISDAVEREIGSDPSRADTDGDGLPDGFELDAGLDPLVGGDGAGDPDGDGADNLAELAAGSDPRVADTDGDGLSDGDEINRHGSDPLRVDTDGDGLSDGVEVGEIGSDPLLADTDGDGLDDRAEALDLGTDPRRADSDLDGMPDGFEVRWFFDPLDPADGQADPDEDGLVNLEEFTRESHPLDPDTDNDGLLDGEEIAAGTDPLDADTDGAGRRDGDELRWDGTDPSDPADDRPTVDLGQTLRDAGGTDWTIGLHGAVQVAGDLLGAAGGHRLSVGGLAFRWLGAAVALQGGRELALGPWRVDDDWQGLLVERRIFVPADGAFVRVVEVLHNAGAEPRRVDVTVAHALSAAPGRVVSSSGDRWVDAADDFVVVAAVEAAPALGHLWSDAFAPAQPQGAALAGEALEWSLPVTVPPGGRVMVMHFTVRAADGLDAALAVGELRRLTGSALAGLEPAERAVIVNLLADPDGDGDGLGDASEAARGTDPARADSDGDGMPDGFEVRAGLDPLGAADADSDVDGDGLTAREEFALGSDPTLADSDGDGLADGDEQAAGADPRVTDTDGDGLTDGDEVHRWGTDPAALDSDDGGRTDFEEVTLDATDPGAAGDDMPPGIARWLIFDDLGYLWDIDGDGRIRTGSMGAFAGGLGLLVDGEPLPALDEVVLTDEGATWLDGPFEMGPTAVWRQIAVPPGEAYGRFVDVVLNRAPTERTVRLERRSLLGPGDRAAAIATSSGGPAFGPADDWLVTDDAENGGAPAVLHVLGGPDAPLRPVSARLDRGAVSVVYEVVLPPNGIATLVHFAAQRVDRAEAVALAEAPLVTNARIAGGLTAGVVRSIVNLLAFADADGDGLFDPQEAALGTDPDRADTDGDGMPDGFEVAGGLDPLDPADGQLDPDGDGLDNAAEFAAGTPLDVADGDRDGLDDGGEVQAGSDPFDPDTDGDDLFDGDEVHVHGTDPLRVDTDGGGVDDALEVLVDGTDPRAPGDDRQPPCDGEVFGGVCIGPLGPPCWQGSARDVCAGLGQRLLTHAELLAAVDGGWVRPEPVYTTLAVDAHDACGGGVGNVELPGFGDLGLVACGDAVGYCNRAIACNAAGVDDRVICSQPSVERAEVTFVNRSPDLRLGLYWYDHGCVERLVAELEPGEAHVAASFARHQWRARDLADDGLLETITVVGDGQWVELPDPLRPQVALCGEADRDLGALFDDGDHFVPDNRPISSCAPDGQTQAMLVSPSGVGQMNAVAWRAYLEAGGVIIAGSRIGDDVYNALFDSNLPEGAPGGVCGGGVEPAFRLEGDPDFWALIGPDAGDLEPGCGADLSALPDIVALGGFDPLRVSLAYVDVGQGRLWLVESDWHADGASGPAFEPSRRLLRHMIGHPR